MTNEEVPQKNNYEWEKGGERGMKRKTRGTRQVGKGWGKKKKFTVESQGV